MESHSVQNHGEVRLTVIYAPRVIFNFGSWPGRVVKIMVNLPEHYDVKSPVTWPSA